MKKFVLAAVAALCLACVSPALADDAKCFTFNGHRFCQEDQSPAPNADAAAPAADTGDVQTDDRASSLHGHQASGDVSPDRTHLADSAVQSPSTPTRRYPTVPSYACGCYGYQVYPRSYSAFAFGIGGRHGGFSYYSSYFGY